MSRKSLSIPEGKTPKLTSNSIRRCAPGRISLDKLWVGMRGRLNQSNVRNRAVARPMVSDT